jgi:hypothetical protein
MLPYFRLFTWAFGCLFSCSLTAQNLRVTLSDVKEIGYEGDVKHYQANFKVTSGNITEAITQLAFPLPDNKIGFALLDTYGDQFKTGQSSSFPMLIKALGFVPKNGQILVSHDLAPIKKAATPNVQFETSMAFLGETDRHFMTPVKNLKGTMSVGDALEYINHKGQKGHAKIEKIEVDFGKFETKTAFEGLPDNTFYLVVSTTEGYDFSDAKVYAANTAPAVTAAPAPVAATPKADVKTIPVEVVLEDAAVKITVHNLVKYKPKKGEGIDIFKIDYSLDYYIVDATFENKTQKSLDVGEYLLRFNFFTPDGVSADEYTRIFRDKAKSPDDADQKANQVDTKIFGGTGKIVMANVLAKYIETIPDYQTKHAAQTQALGKPLAPGAKIRSIDATIMGVPPSYNIEGLGTWTGTFYDKKKLLYKKISL